ncbi:hypothetical protein Vafri_5204 [Volvox africanus]|uniref:MRN complex-interacting protein N-terminal domain-containing protein n=1 Tax=Volvox africanus TaxID=51714 RepID=A0A8J4EVI9_9CHLO|nr:hypothetical protein Vafri_5204 [Volvox africanus]
MPQQFQAVKCYKCNTFQVQQVKKVQKFNCAICGEKQTIQHIYAISNAAKDIRLHVQRLNLGTAADREAEEQAALQRLGQVPDYAEDPDAPSRAQVDRACIKRAASDWTDFPEDYDGAGLGCVVNEDCEDGIVTVLPDSKRGCWARSDQGRPYKQRRKEEGEPIWQMSKTHTNQVPAQGQDHTRSQYRPGSFGKPAQHGYSNIHQHQHSQHAQPQASLSLGPRPYSHRISTPNPSCSGVMPAPQTQSFQRHHQLVPSLSSPPSQGCIPDPQGAAHKSHQHQQYQPHNRWDPHPQHPLHQGQQQPTFPAPTPTAPGDATRLPTAYDGTTGVDALRTTAGGPTDLILHAPKGPPERAHLPSFGVPAVGAPGLCGWGPAKAAPRPRMCATFSAGAHEQRGSAASLYEGPAKAPAGKGLWTEFEEDGGQGDCGLDDEEGFVTCL